MNHGVPGLFSPVNGNVHAVYIPQTCCLETRRLEIRPSVKVDASDLTMRTVARLDDLEVATAICVSNRGRRRFKKDAGGRGVRRARS
jgi:hypothetical protein